MDEISATIKAKAKGKEFYYVGHYISKEGKYVLKPGTTNDLKRRRQEHNRAYHKTPNFPMDDKSSFEYDWFIPLSKYNTLRVEDRMKEKFQAERFGVYVNNDRFVFDEKPEFVEITVKRIYKIAL
jgi:predicted GIY-YIG superfamily endonuclease